MLLQGIISSWIHLIQQIIIQVVVFYVFFVGMQDETGIYWIQRGGDEKVKIKFEQQYLAIRSRRWQDIQIKEGREKRKRFKTKSSSSSTRQKCTSVLSHRNGKL